MKRWTIAIVALLMATQAQATQPRTNSSLAQLISGAERVFLGTVDSIEQRKEIEKFGHEQASVLVRIVVFDPIYRLKGVPAGQKVTVRQYDSFAMGVGQGQKVLWFLDSPSDVGYENPMGREGYFRIVAARGDPQRKLAVNLLRNKGLWQGSVWDALGITKEVTATCQFLRDLDPARRQEILTRGDRPSDDGPIPLELLLAVVHTKVSMAKQ